MRIGIDCRLWNQKGVGRYIRNLTTNLSKIDKINKYFLFVRSEDYKEVKSQFPVSNFQFPICDIPWHSIKEQTDFPKILKKENLDLVHFPYISVPIFYKGPFILTVHDLIPFHLSTGEASTKPLIFRFKKLGYKFVISKAVGNAKKIIVPSHATKKDVAKHLNISQDKVFVIYEGVDPNIKSSRGNRLIKENYFLYVGNAYPHKNIDFLIQVFNELKFRDFKLVLVGKEDHFYRKLKDKFPNRNIIYFGEASDDQLSNLYKNAFAYITPSVMEGFGLTGLEAMANGCLVLASDIPVHREIYKEGALYFDPKNSKVLRDLMEKVWKDPSKFKNTVLNGQGIIKKFSWKKMAKETLKIYESSISLR